MLCEVHCTVRELHFLNLALNAATDVKELRIKDVSRRPNSFHKQCRFEWIELLVRAAKGTPVSPTKTFAKLKKVNIALGLHTSGQLRLETLSSILQLPSIDDLTFSGFIEAERIANWGCPERASNVKKLALENSFLCSDVVAQLLSSCRSLTDFTYFYSSTDNFEPFADVYSPKSHWVEHSWTVIGEELQRHKDTLQSLSLFYETDPVIVNFAAENGYDVDTGNLGSLQDFKNLKSLSAPIDALVPQDAEPKSLVEHLPLGIESLDVRFDNLTTLEPVLFGRMMSSLATECSDSILKTVRISVGNHIQVHELQLSAIANELKKAGVKMWVTRDYMHRLGRPVKEINGDVGDGGTDFNDEIGRE
jgi:hypothetical protein